MRPETYIRGTELGMALASTYMVAVTLIQTSFFEVLRPYLAFAFSPFLMGMGADSTGVDFITMGLAMGLSFLFWRRGDEAGFGRLFMLNMLMFFPAILDFSMFNWIRLIIQYDLLSKVSEIWVFTVGLLLQATYLTLRYTGRFRELRVELLERGAEEADIDQVSIGQVTYLAELVIGTAAISAVLYLAVPYVRDYIGEEVSGMPYPHIIIGFICAMFIAAATIIYLRGGAREVEKLAAQPEHPPEPEPAKEPEPKEEAEPDEGTEPEEEAEPAEDG